ncbi:MAG: Rieske (2Fe-2S) protein [Chthoniobacterales bacterium]
MNRRKFLTLTTTAVTVCMTVADKNSIATLPERVVDAGPLSNYAVDGLYGGFRDQGFFLIRKGTQLLALSATCTHRKCKLTAEPDRSFYCKCHGSTFGPGGNVTQGPAKRDLPMFATTVDGRGHLLVKVPFK